MATFERNQRVQFAAAAGTDNPLYGTVTEVSMLLGVGTVYSVQWDGGPPGVRGYTEDELLAVAS